MVSFAVVRSIEGRSGGRPGMGAVMGSKLLKAIVIRGSRPIPQAFPAGDEDARPRRPAGGPPDDKDAAWSVQGTTGVLPWCNEVAALPVHNFRGRPIPTPGRWTGSG